MRGSLNFHDGQGFLAKYNLEHASLSQNFAQILFSSFFGKVKKVSILSVHLLKSTHRSNQIGVLSSSS